MGISNMEVKKINRNTVLRHLLQRDVVSKNDVAQALKMSVPTVSRILQELLALGLVAETGALDSIGGRKAKGYQCLKAARVAVGVDITRNHINIAVIDLAMNLLYSDRIRIRLLDREASYQALEDIVRQAIEASGVRSEQILGIGFSLPAIIDDAGRTIHGMHEQMELSRDFYRIVRQRFSCDVLLDNDANSAGRAEMMIQNIQTDSVFFFVSPSVGGAIFHDGVILTGQTCRAGEFGHLTLVPDGRPCYCGRAGCVNAYCSTENLSDLTDHHLDLFFKKLAERDERLLPVWDRYLDDLALAIHNLLTVLDNKIIIVGYLGQYIGPYLEDLKKRVQAYDPYLIGKDFMAAGQLKYEASAIGVAARYIESYIKNI